MASTDTVIANDGTALPIDSLAKTFGPRQGELMTSITVEYAGKVYVQTFTNDGLFITHISMWEVQ